MAIQYLPVALQLGDMALRSYSDQLRSEAHSKNLDIQKSSIAASVDIAETREQARTERAEIYSRLEALRIKHQNEVQNKMIALELDRTERHYALCNHMLEISERAFKSKLEAFTESYRATRSVLEAELAFTNSELEALSNFRCDASLDVNQKRKAIREIGDLRIHKAELIAELSRNEHVFKTRVRELNIDVTLPEVTPLFLTAGSN